MMKFFARMMMYAATAMTLCTVLFSFTGAWFGEQGSVLQFAREVLYERRRFDALQYRSDVVQHAMESKVRIIDQLLSGRLCLREAIVRYQRVNQQLREELAVEGMDQALLPPYRVPPTDPESVGRQILNWARSDVAEWPPHKAERVLADLEHAFRDLFGKASLSDPSADAMLTHSDAG